MKALILSIITPLFATFLVTAQQDSTIIYDQEVVLWLKGNSIPIKTIEAGNGFTDLEPFKETLKDVKIIGLGESNHGTSEFFEMKHRMIEFLVTQMGFTAFVLETSYSDYKPLNEYILYGKGNLEEALTFQERTAWDCKEFVELLEWLKDYNSTAQENKKVHLYGMDISSNHLGRKEVLEYLKKYAPDKYSSVDSLFQRIYQQEKKWPFWGIDQSVLAQELIPLQELILYFRNNKSQFVKSSSNQEWNVQYRYLQVMEQWVLSNIKSNSITGVSVEKSGRLTYVGQNLNYLIDKEDPKTKFIVWAGMGHLQSRGVRAGGQLKERFGDAYYPMLFLTYQGAYRSQKFNMAIPLSGELMADSISTKEKTINGYLHNTDEETFFVDLRKSNINPLMKSWMKTRQKMVRGAWRFNGKGSIKEYKLYGHYEGILFIDQSTPTHPTENAKKRANGIIQN